MDNTAKKVIISRIIGTDDANDRLSSHDFYVNISRDCFAMSVATAIAIARLLFHRHRYQRQFNIDIAARVMSNMAAESKIAFRSILGG